MTRIQQLAVALGWDRQAAERVKQVNAEFTPQGVKRQRRLNAEFELQPDEVRYQQQLRRVKQRLDGGV